MTAGVAINIQQRYDTAANWTASNPILLSGEIGWESDTGKGKQGNGTSAWSALSYITGGSSGAAGSLWIEGDNGGVPGTAPDASGSDALAIGDGAVASAASALAAGKSTTATGAGATAVGQGADATANNATAIGNSAAASGADTVAIGDNSSASQTGAVAIGNNAVSSGSGTPSTAIGDSADATGASSLAAGRDAQATATNATSAGGAANASAVGATAIGAATVASGAGAIAVGENADATAANAVAIGGSSTDANSANATAASAIAVGVDVTSDRFGEAQMGGAKFSTAGDFRASVFNHLGSTTNSTPTEIFVNGTASNRITIPSDTTLGFTTWVTARRTDVDGESAFYKLEGCIDNNAGTTALVGTVTKTVIAEDTAAWDVNTTADNTNDAIVITVTGENAKTIRWGCRTQIVSVNG